MALRNAIVQTFDATALIQRCQEHKHRKVLEHLPAGIRRPPKDARAASDAESSRRRPQRLASSPRSRHPGAAASVRDGLDETLMVQELGVTEALHLALHTTNPIESDSVARYCRGVKH